jgi:hypothetical protein
MSVLAVETVTVIRAPLVADRYGGQVRDWTAAVRTDVDGVSIQPTVSTEDVRDRELLVSRYTLFTTRGRDIDLLATDRIQWNGLVLQVDGDPNRWAAPGGGLHHLEANLKQVTG